MVQYIKHPASGITPQKCPSLCPPARPSLSPALQDGWL